MCIRFNEKLFLAEVLSSELSQYQKENISFIQLLFHKSQEPIVGKLLNVSAKII